MLRLVLVILAAVALFHALLWLLQDRMIYFPKRYGFGPELVPHPIQLVRYVSSAKLQTAFYLPPPSGTRTRLWLVFGGNAMTALDWLDWAQRHPDPDAAFLLIDYPGYGFNDGAPSQASIAAASDAAFAALAAHLEVSPEALAAQTQLLGHSLGAGVALEFAVRHPPRYAGERRGIVLTAPFSSVRDVAAAMFGPLIRPLVHEDYDNVARLAELAVATPTVVILHGRQDEIIAFRFGERLARSAPWVRFIALEEARHNDLYQVAPEAIRQAMAEVVARPPP